MIGVFIPNITAEMFRNGCLESIEALMAEGEIYDIEYQRWIPVSERLPENDGRYLTYIINKHDDKLQYIMTCDYSVDGYGEWFPDAESASDNVVAWMPLPKSYKAERGE